VDADKNAVSASKELLDEASYKEIVSYDAYIRRWLQERAVPPYGTFRPGVYRVPVALVAELDAMLERFAGFRDRYVKLFLAAYPQAVTEAKSRLRGLYAQEDYPSVERVAKAFKFEYQYMAMAVPGQLADISIDMLQREQAKAREQADAEIEQIRMAMREAFGTLMEHAADRLKVDRQGKKQIFRDSLVKNLEEFFAYFTARNIVQDNELSGMVERARLILKGVDAETLRSDDGARNRVRKGLTEIRAEMDRNLEDMPTRRIQLSEDGED